ncbi:MAG: hypothetical protein EA427_08530 [Spirochaetaceae bacterium]|nr:MAG: hypothetical protein EA427_08530 [Spirochaetaceae bacterium]
MLKMARLLQERFVAVLLLFVLLGFLVPGLERVPSSVLILSLALLIFISSFGISLEEVRRIAPLQTGLFYVLRFPVLGILLWVLANALYPGIATAVLLLSLAPAGVASPGVSSIYRGNISLSILIVVVSAFLAPFLIPLVLQLFVARQINLEVWPIFRTLLISVFLPLVAHLPFRRTPAARWLRTHDALIVVPTIGILVMLVISRQKAFILAHILEAAIFVAITIVLYVLYYAFGWFLFPRAPRRNRISFTLGSGVNNTAIVIVLASLYFAPEVSTFLVSAELAWVAGMVLFKRFIESHSSFASDGAAQAP